LNYSAISCKDHQLETQFSLISSLIIKFSICSSIS